MGGMMGGQGAGGSSTFLPLPDDPQHNAMRLGRQRRHSNASSRSSSRSRSPMPMSHMNMPMPMAGEFGANSPYSRSRPGSPAFGMGGGSPSGNSSLLVPGAQSDNESQYDSDASLSREKLSELAAPPHANKKTQKNPAIYGCHICDKKFTRPYNLKSHLRTHTNERPFLCTICGKAFARQHDRKRHEDLHSGEKKFQCRVR
ncbi:unnamed protein product [Ambrosiozyma monospora]|uniref:Unnamed protein product n=1 Tax=Ambrosiozyma monospora TaxID=43982 RepID=A0ACB5UAJ6_AMBMO|nr:unnamed protein product [Ambrosiozyma monospora]